MRTSRGRTPTRPRVIFLAGAPKPADLRWDESALIQHPPPIAISRPDEVRVSSSLCDADPDGTSPSFLATRPRWRALSVPQLPPAAVLSTSAPAGHDHSVQDDFDIEPNLHVDRGPYVGPDPPSFLPIDLPENTPESRSQLDRDLLRHSFSVHATMFSFTDLSAVNDSMVLDDSSFVSSAPSSSDPSATDSVGEHHDNGQSVQQPKPVIPRNLPITNIRTLPIAGHLTQISPQSITVNLICGVLTIYPLRTVTIRPRSNWEDQVIRTMDIQELLVGDDTAAGFSISFWLQSQTYPCEDSYSSAFSSTEESSIPETPPMSPGRAASTTAPTAAERAQAEVAQQQAALRAQLADLRVGDTILLTNIALSSFRGKVHGQSVSRKASTFATTRVVVLQPAAVTAAATTVNATDNVCCFTHVVSEKLNRVHEWVARFICGQQKRQAAAPTGETSAAATTTAAAAGVEEKVIKEEKTGRKRKGWWGTVVEDESLPPDTPT